ncbi:MAG: hypothetical protein LC634_09895 [Sphingomonadales bacterium]|nr:hypothetical protein [Sphingomonadales bacterium]
MIESANILPLNERPSIYDAGLTIVEHGALNPLHRGIACVEGGISYVGCNTAEIVCNDAAFEYGISVRRVLRQ